MRTASCITEVYYSSGAAGAGEDHEHNNMPLKSFKACWMHLTFCPLEVIVYRFYV